METKYLAIPAALAQGIGEYLATRPWSEVHQAMAMLQNLQPVPEQVPQIEPTDKVE